MKKILAFLLLCLSLLTVAGCSRNDENTLYFLNFKPEQDMKTINHMLIEYLLKPQLNV